MPKNLSQIAKQKKIKYFLISFVDLFGVLRSKLVPAQAIAEMQKNGAGFAGFATWLDMTPADSDMFAIPDPDSLIQLPWNKEIGWLASDLYMDGKPVEASPRVMLKNQIQKLKAKKLQMKSGVECEYFLISEDGLSIADPRDIQSKPCYDQSALMRRYDLIKEICDSMIELGWKPYQNDHEDANGQFEMNWDYSDSLVTADRHVFFKFMVKNLAEKHGLPVCLKILMLLPYPTIETSLIFSLITFITSLGLSFVSIIMWSEYLISFIFLKYFDIFFLKSCSERLFKQIEYLKLFLFSFV